MSAVFGGLFWATEMPLRRTLMGEFAGPHRVGNAMSFEAITNNATRMAGPLMMAAGLIALAAAFVPGVLAFWMMGAAILVAVLVPAVYSYLVYRKLQA